MTILVTGGAGYIGSHTVVLLQEAGYDVVIFDNLSNSNPEVFNRIEELTGKRPLFIRGDIRDPEALDSVFRDQNIDAVIHFAGLKAVGESVEKPVLYYRNNVEGSVKLFEAMEKHSCKRIVFSSSATVYGDPASVPIREDFPLSATNPYGRSKLMIEDILRDLQRSDNCWQTAILRYFNPVGAHPSGRIGEDPNGIPNNLMPYIAQVAVGKLPELKVFGDDYDTPDGTGVRDYIHVMDLAAAHLKALEALTPEHGCTAYNIGTGQGYSVLEAANAFAAASEREIPYSIAPRRAGDIAECYADPAFSESTLMWQARYGMEEMVRDHWRWQSENPHGYTES
ncbi:UDP-glucose 4-epimerase GalE [Marinobacterium jannaschii]|uniref:UDP-glucose 4-epimerase GalE n=1 Tax=Marinobacterium jannaschii TaxID=64970 RepID=UPI00047F357F|nr:UDP-glucose 4-epimerase GalE [Marinobacterium jannaschii]